MSTANPTAGSLFVTLYKTGGGSVITPAIPIFATDVGKTMVLHIQADGTAARVCLNGKERLSGTAMADTNKPPAGAAAIQIGKSDLGGAASGDFALLDLAYTPTLLTMSQVDADAAAIMSRRARLSFPTMPGTTLEYDARDLAASPTTWVPKIGTGTLTKNGTVSVNTETAVTWVRNAGNIMAVGDSQIRNSFYDPFVGAQFQGIEDKFIADGWHYDYVGPFSDGWGTGADPLVQTHHRGVSGETAAICHAGDGGSLLTLAAYLALYRPCWVLLGHLTNDFGADLVNQATAGARMQSLIADVVSSCPWAKAWLWTLAVPHGPLYAATAAQFTTWNTNLPHSRRQRGAVFQHRRPGQGPDGRSAHLRWVDGLRRVLGGDAVGSRLRADVQRDRRIYLGGVMDWTPILAGIGSSLVTGGVIAGVAQYIKARAKNVEAEAKAVEAGAAAHDREVTAKIQLVEAKAKATKAEAEMDAYMVKRVEELEKKVELCESAHGTCEAALASQATLIRQMQGDLDTLFVKSGLTPRDRTAT